MLQSNQVLLTKNAFTYTSIDGNTYKVEKDVRAFVCKQKDSIIVSLIMNNPDGSQPNFYIYPESNNEILENFILDAPKIFEPSLIDWSVGEIIDLDDIDSLNRVFSMNLYHNQKLVGCCSQKSGEHEPLYKFNKFSDETLFNNAIQKIKPEFLKSPYANFGKHDDIDSIIKDVVSNFFLDGYQNGYLDVRGYFDFQEEACELSL